MDDRAARGEALRAAVAARPGLMIKTLCALACVSEPTYRAAIRGKASVSSYEALEAALQQWDEHPEPPDDPRVITVELVGIVGVESIKIRGYSDAVEQLTEAVQGVLDSVRNGKQPTTQSPAG